MALQAAQLKIKEEEARQDIVSIQKSWWHIIFFFHWTFPQQLARMPQNSEVSKSCDVNGPLDGALVDLKHLSKA